MPYAPCEEHEMLLLPHRLTPVLYTLASVIGKATIEFSFNQLRASKFLSAHAASFGENHRNGVKEYCRVHLIFSISTLLVPAAMTMDLQA